MPSAIFQQFRKISLDGCVFDVLVVFIAGLMAICPILPPLKHILSGIFAVFVGLWRTTAVIIVFDARCEGTPY